MTALRPLRVPSAVRPGHEGYRTGEPGYRRISIALFAAGVATFALIYSTQALLPEFTGAFSISAAQSTLSVSLTTIGLASRCWSPARCPRWSAARG
jgi:YNFM family putative membrane transporter